MIRQRYPDKITRFVFPSEIAAAFWRKETLRLTELKAVESSRFLSWDRFKEDSFALFRNERPVNALLRTIFVYRLLEKNRETGTDFAGIISGEYAGNSPAFLGYIVRILPSLGMLAALPKEKCEALDRDFFGTLRRLLHLYREFLSTHGLFEPGYERADLSAVRFPAVIFFPELIEDYGENAALLEANPKITVLSRGEKERAGELFHLFENSLHEFDWVFGKITALLEKGTHPDDIAVTVCDEKVLPYFQNAAEGYPVVFSYRGGKNVTDYPAGRFFLYLQECADSGFHIEKLKKLLLPGTVPWKDRKELEALVLAGINSLYVMEEPGKDRNARRLRRALEGKGEKMVSFFLRLHRGVLSITESKNISRLRTALIAFSSAFFDQERWDNVNARVFEYALNLCADMKNSLKTVELPETLSPFQLFLYLLRNSMYVPKAAAGGISVYPYRVAAGIDPRYHFLVSAHHTAVQAAASPYGFLRKDQKAALRLEDRDMSSDFMKVYTLSGKETSVSCVLETFSEKTLVPAYVMKHFPEKIETEQVPPGCNPFNADRLFWESAGAENPPAEPAVLLPLQRLGLRTMTDRIIRPAGQRYNGNPIENASLREKISERVRKDGIPAVSPTSLERFVRCPFAYLLDAALGRDEPEYEAAYHNAGLAGQFSHEVLRVLYGRIRDATECFLPEKRELYSGFLEEAVEEVSRKYYGRGYIFLLPVQAEMKGKTRKYVDALFDLEARHFPGLPVAAAEQEFLAEWKSGNGPGEAAVLRGKIDRLSGAAGSAVLLDYKTKNRITRKDITGEADVPPASFQIPMYVFLAEQNGLTVSRAGYISLSEGKYVPVMKTEEDGKGWFSREELDGGIEEMHRYIGEMVRQIQAGYYPVPEEECSPCAYRSVCRVKYSIG